MQVFNNQPFVKMHISNSPNFFRIWPVLFRFIPSLIDLFECRAAHNGDTESGALAIRGT